MHYCCQKGIKCNFANSTGFCTVTGCLNHYEAVVVENSGPAIATYTNTCEVCGQPTEDTYHHVCAKCRLKLHDLLYNDKKWGLGE